jgi:LPS O-antigen subunit length determinant protein (WzzB/FepE family)
VSRSTNILTILRINTPMNTSTHSARNADAARIAAAISESMKGLPDYSKILAISVDYVEQTEKSARNKLVDRIELRKNANGLFETHVS